MSAGAVHRPVLLHEAVASLGVTSNGIYMDLTYGRGGHAGAILERLGPQGRLLVMDRDPEAIADARRRLGADGRVVVRHGAFGSVAAAAADLGWTGRVSGVLVDLGVSSAQLDDSRRGFSFMRDGPLDMRMDPATGPSAADWLATADEGEIVRVLREYGEERQARRIARAIVADRAEQPFVRTGQLRDLIGRIVRAREPGRDPATRTFQAIRIHVNRELEELERLLADVLAVLAPGGRFVAIAFHSLEDRLVKRFIRRHVRGDDLPADLPVPDSARRPRLRSIGGAVRPGAEEVRANPRARSAIMRVAETVP